MRIVSFPEPDTPRELRAQVLRLQRQAWPSDEPLALGPTHDPALSPLSMLLVEDGRVLAALDVLSKDIVHCGRRYSAGGLSTVVTDQELRESGFGGLLVEAAYAAIEKSGVDLGIFTCDPPLQGFYERAGWSALPGTVLIGGTPDTPLPSDALDKVTIGRFISVGAQRERMTFVGSRIGLYPGEIDKLW